MIKLTLFRCSAERNRVNKSPYFTGGSKVVSGIFREPVDILNPTIDISYENYDYVVGTGGYKVVDSTNNIILYGDDIDSVAMHEYNYAYIPTFNRYYFVTRVTIIRSNLFRYDFHVDPLMSFQTEIWNLTPLIARYQNSTNFLLADPQAVMPANAQYSVLDSTGTTVFDTTFSTRYIITCLTNIIFTGSQPTLRKTFNSNAKYVVDRDTLDAVIEKMNDPDFATGMANIFKNDPIEGIISVRMYPFNFASLWDLGDPDTIYLGNYDTGEQGYLCSSSSDTPACEIWQPYIYAAQPSGAGAWSYYADDVQVFLPFYGFINISPEQFYGRYIHAKYVLNVDTGTADIHVYSATSSAHNFSENCIIWEGSCTIAVDIPVSQSNSLECVRNSLIGGLTGIMSIAAAPASGGLSLGGLGGSIAGQLGNLVHSFNRGGQTGGAWGGFFAYTRPFALIGHKSPVYPSNYAATFGYPYHESANLGTVFGFVQVEEVHLEGFDRALTPELEEIEQALKSGVIL